MATQSSHTQYPGAVVIGDGARLHLCGPFTQTGKPDPFYLLALEIGRVHISLNIDRAELIGLARLPIAGPDNADLLAAFGRWLYPAPLTFDDIRRIGPLAMRVVQATDR